MNIQIFGTKKVSTPKRRSATQGTPREVSIRRPEGKGLSKGELESVARAAGGH